MTEFIRQLKSASNHHWSLRCRLSFLKEMPDSFVGTLPGPIATRIRAAKRRGGGVRLSVTEVEQAMKHLGKGATE